jgi:fatty acid desaturase
MTEYPYQEIPVDWKRPPIDRAVLQKCMQRSDAQGFFHMLGILAIFTATGTWAYLMYASQQWLWMALALYIHGGVYEFGSHRHELIHGTVFKTRGLNTFFVYLMNFIRWPDQFAAFRISHKRHHTYTLHRCCDGEEVHPRAAPLEHVLQTAATPVDLTQFLHAVYDRIYGLFVPYLRNPRRTTWQRYVYSKATPKEQQIIRWMHILPMLAHIAFGIAAAMSGVWFLIVVVSLPAFYGAKWYFVLIHTTMHIGCKPEVDNFHDCCRTVRLDPLSSFLYFHMEWHTEHHTYAGVPCYNLKKLHRLTKEHWKKPVSLVQAWRDMDRFSRRLLKLEGAELAAS